MARISKDMIKPFTGEGDVVAYIRKVQLVAKLQDVKDVASLLPLYLEGDALALYLELDEDSQADADAITAKLKEAFSDGPFSAFAKLVNIRWTGQQVDVFANEIRRLAGLAGFVDSGLDRILRLTFVNGFPGNISANLQQVSGIMKMPMSDIIARARILCTKISETDVVAVGVQQGTGSRMDSDSHGFRGKCYRCGGSHPIRYCSEQRVRCFKCNKFGHIATNCEQFNKGEKFNSRTNSEQSNKGEQSNSGNE